MNNKKKKNSTTKYTKWMTGYSYNTKEDALKSAKSTKLGWKLDNSINVQTRVIRKKNWRGKYKWYPQERMTQASKRKYVRTHLKLR